MGGGDYDSMQVRIVGPTLGLAKGMLLKRQGISRIQLPTSMLKAKRSSTCNDKYAAVIIKNFFPSGENKQLGRLLDPGMGVACKSWISQDKKLLSTMYQRMLVGFGIKESDVQLYAKSARNPEKLKHGQCSTGTILHVM